MTSQHEHTLSGSKRKAGFTDQARPRQIPDALSRQPHSSQFSDGSSSLRSSSESRLPMMVEQPLLRSMQAPVTVEGVFTHTIAPFETPPNRSPFPFPSPERSEVYTLPPLSLSVQKAALLTSQAENPLYESLTEDPTLQSLQRENEELVSAYSQAQIRVLDLDRLVQVSRLEIEKLLEERQGLRGKVDALEAELDELQASVEVAQQHRVTKDAQYLKILELSTKLQSRAEFGGQQSKVHNEQWELEKYDMLQTITALQSELRTLRTTYTSVPQPEQGHTIRGVSGSERMLSGIVTAAAAPTSPMKLETEVIILRKAISAMKDTLSKVRQEHAHSFEYVEKLGGLGRDIQRHLQAEITGEGIASTVNWQMREDWQDLTTDDQ